MSDQAKAGPLALPPDRKILLSIHEVAAILDISHGTVATWEADGRMPPAVRIGRRRLWPRAVLEAWAAAGCPPAATWERIREGA